MLMQEIVFYVLLHNLHCIVIVMSEGEQFSTYYIIYNQLVEFQFFNFSLMKGWLSY